jgi:aldose 1-epimerase
VTGVGTPAQPGAPVRYGTLPNGRAVDRYVLSRDQSLSVGILTYGGILDAIDVPDAAGTPRNVVLGYRDLAGYRTSPNTYFGAIIGRYANRIAQGCFVLNASTYALAVNNPPNALHGGLRGFDKVVWDVEEARPDVLRLHHVSLDGDEGYPGTLDTRVSYTLGAAGELRIAYTATTDAPTIVNLTNHTYFNLAGEDAGDILDHVLTIDAQRYTPIDANLIPTGELATVAGTPFDFRTPHAIGARLRQPHPQLVTALGYDHNWVLDPRDADSPARAARAEDPASGRILEVLTTEPGIQFYSGNFLTGSEVGRGGAIYRQSAGFALETQHFPDSPNQPSFPTTVLAPGQTFMSETVLRFSAQPV